MLGSQLAMPILVINMGGEMIYILHQRLQAQNISDEKARKVLEDVIRTMYTPVFLEELFKPQEMYSNSSTKQIFDKLAHSSIMRLNKQSMEKLYDLMSMGVKFQVLACSCPQQYLQITLQHLEALAAIVQADSVKPLITSAISRCINLYTNLSQGNWLLLQQTILQFFQGRKVKVSLFLQQELQSLNGVLILNNNGKLPFNADIPGIIRYFENGSVVHSQRFPTSVDGQVELSSTVFDHNSPRGKNMYLRPEANNTSSSSSPPAVPLSFRDAEHGFARTMEASGAQAHRPYAAMDSNSDALLTSATAAPKTQHLLSTDASSAASKSSSGSSSNHNNTGESSAKAELSVLADLLGIHSHASNSSGSSLMSKAEGKNSHGAGFRLNLVESRGGGFASASSTAKGGDFDNGEKYEDDDAFVITIDIDASIGAKTVDSYMRDLDLRDDAKAERKHGGNDDDEDDLLALMDSAK